MSRNFDILSREAIEASRATAAASLPRQARKFRHSTDRIATAEEEVAKLVQGVFRASGDKSPRMVAFCGADKGAGCTWVCARAGEAVAEQTSGEVCLVDANLRSPALPQYFHLENSPGLADAVRTSAPVREFVYRAWSDHLWVMPAGAAGSTPNGALNPERLRTRLAELRQEFEYVLLDTPPVSSFRDALLLGQLTDGVVLVVGSNSTRRETARVAKESFVGMRIPVLGAVLNKRQFPIPDAIYQRL